jgi:hypothetical protein
VKTIPRYIPQGAEKLEHPDDLGTVYLYGPEKRCAIAYKGQGGRASWNYSFKGREGAEKYASDWFDSLTSWQERQTQWRAEANKPHTLKVGDVIYNSWGYDQTNIDWYQVVRVSEHFVWLRRIGANVKETSFMAGPTIPKPNQFVGEEVTQHKATTNEHGTHITFEYGSGSKWDGQSLYCSWYA